MNHGTTLSMFSPCLKRAGLGLDWTNSTSAEGLFGRYIGIYWDNGKTWKLELLQHVGIIWAVKKAAALDVHRCMFPENRPFRLLRPRPRYSGIRGSRYPLGNIRVILGLLG